MKVEIHSHTRDYSACSRIQPRDLVAMAEAMGYGAIFLTDHGRVWRKDELSALQRLSRKVRVFSGIEVSLPDRIDVLVLGADDPAYEELRLPHQLLAQASADGFLTVIAHPFRWNESLPRYCLAADAIELCTCNHPQPEWVEAARLFAAEHGLAGLYASDAHGLNFLNKFWIETEDDFATPQEFRRLAVTGRYNNRTRPFDMPLPPPFKAGNISELPEEDQLALFPSPEPVL